MNVTGVDVLARRAAGVNLVAVRVRTDEPGLVGYGNGTLVGGEHALATLLDRHIAPRLVGLDPDRVEDVNQLIRRATYWRGGRVVAAAVAAVDIALWDLKGKRAGLPVYSLLGGRCRDRVLCYGHAKGDDAAQVSASVARYRADGFRAIRAQVATPGYRAGSYGMSTVYEQQPASAAAPPAPDRVQRWEPRPYLRAVPELFARLRADHGPEVMLLHDAHDRLTPIEAAQLARSLESYDLVFLEDPLPVDNAGGLALVREHSVTPLAIGERFTSARDALPLIQERLVDFVRNAVTKSGGISELRKLAVLAEPSQVRTAFQCPPDVGPLGYAATIHLDLAVPNFGIQERPAFSPAMAEIFSGLPVLADGYLDVTDAAGLGVDVDWDALAAAPPIQPTFPPVIRRDDGSLQDP